MATATAPPRHEETQAAGPGSGTEKTSHAGHGAASHRSHHAPGGHHGEEGHEGAPEWLISFADNVMLQMGFFVILLALAMKAPGGGPSKSTSEGQAAGGAPTAEQLDFALAVREAFNNPVDLNSTDPRDFLLVQRLRARLRGSSDARSEGLRGAEHDVQSIRRTGVYGDGGAILFESNSAALTAEGQSAVAELARQFRGYQTRLDIRGHCSAAEAYGRADRGMQLSYERAFAVAQALAAEGVEWQRLRVTACADNDRVATTAYDEAGHRLNQRVEVVQIEQAAPGSAP